MFPPIINLREITYSYIIAPILILRMQELNVKERMLWERVALQRLYQAVCVQGGLE